MKYEAYRSDDALEPTRRVRQGVVQEMEKYLHTPLSLITAESKPRMDSRIACQALPFLRKAPR